jgi:hypothetical protein
MRVIDPDASGDMTKQEFRDFMTMSNEELEARQIEHNAEGSFRNDDLDELVLSVSGMAREHESTASGENPLSGGQDDD